MPYLNLDLDYFDHPKTKRLVGLLGRGSDVLPVRLWCYCGKFHADTGDMTSYSPIEIETLIGWWGQPGKAVEALAKLQFLDAVGLGYKVHDWDKINGHIAALRDRAQAGAAERWRRYREEKAIQIAQAMLKQSPSNAISNALQEEGREGSLLHLDPDLDLKSKEDSIASGVPGESVAATRLTLLKAQFDEVRKSYPGTRGGLTVEWANFEKKNKADLADIIPLMGPAIVAEKLHKEIINRTRTDPLQWKHFTTWINKRCWEQELEAVDGKNGSSRGTGNSAPERNNRKLTEQLGKIAGAAGIGAGGSAQVLHLLPQGDSGSRHDGR